MTLDPYDLEGPWPTPRDAALASITLGLSPLAYAFLMEITEGGRRVEPFRRSPRWVSPYKKRAGDE